jgi:DNA-binding NarL/FixJ family response regulator
VLVVDDHDLVRTGLRAVLDGDPALEVVAEAADGLQALAAADAQRPDVVVMDLQMPTMDGFESIRRLRAAHPALTVLVLTMFDDDASVFAALRAGAHGYVLKGAPRDELRTAVVAVASGQSVFGAGIAGRVRDLLLTGHSATDPFPELTRRERHVLDLLVEGRAVPAIARRLGVSDKTVRNNVSSILNKLHATDRAAAVDIARRRTPRPGPVARPDERSP